MELFTLNELSKNYSHVTFRATLYKNLTSAGVFLLSRSYFYCRVAIAAKQSLLEGPQSALNCSNSKSKVRGSFCLEAGQKIPLEAISAADKLC